MPVKKSKNIKILLLILVILSATFLRFHIDKEFSNEDNFNYENLKISGISGRIHVNNNWSATKAAGICTGQGTLADPYVIRDLIIDVGGPEYGILIENTNEYFEIIYCSIFNSDTYPGAGIRLSYVENGIIENNNCSYNNRGIRIEDSSKVMVRNNTLYENGFGIEIETSNEVTALQNNFSKSYQAIYTYISSDCTLNENFLRDCEIGINLYLSSRMTLLENLMENCGIVCDASINAVSSHDIDETNLVNGKPVRYYSSQTGIYVPSNTGQIIMANCSLSTVENQNINNATDAIEILFCSNITITGNNCSFNSRNGIYLDHSYNNTIHANNCSNNWDGIDLTSSEENLVSDNDCIDNRDGIYLYGSDNNKVIGNNCSKNVEGITLHYSESNNVENNFCPDNIDGIVLSYADKSIVTGNLMTKGGIICWGSKEIVTSLTIDTTNLVNGKPVRYYVNQSYVIVPYNTGQVILANCNSSIIENLNIFNTNIAINILYSSNNTILENNCSYNSNAGIYLYYSNNNTISKNNCSTNFNCGINLLYSETNTIRENLCDLSGTGVGIYYSGNNKIIENNCSKNDIAIYITSCDNAFITGNLMQESGLALYGGSIEDFSHSIDTTNLVNGKPVYYYVNQNNIIVPQNAGQVIMINCTSSIIKNIEISHATIAITVLYSSNITISENFCSENNFSIVDYYSYNFQFSGIYIYQCRNMNVSKNICTNNNMGIYSYLSENSSFIENNCSGNYGGIFLVGHNNSIKRNNCTDNDIGFILAGTNNSMTENNILNNVYGMYHGSSINNEIYLNNFINNINYFQFEESSNIWNSPSEITYNYSNQIYNNYLGNYWDDYNGNDIDGDGIGDSPLNLGNSETDYYPLMDKFEDYLKLPLESLIPFNGLYLNYSFSSLIFGSGPSHLSYSQILPNLFHAVGDSELWTSQWDVNSFTRILSNCSGSFTLVNGSHTPVWIFTDINIGDNVLISVDGEGDHTFEVSDEVFITLPGYGILEAWKLIDLTEPGGIAIYEKSTGILLNSTFYYYGGIYNYSLTLTGTNALNQTLNCIIQLQKDGIEISEIDGGEFFDIYVGDSFGNNDIEQVRFSSDDEQDGIVMGTWTDWYDWDNSSGDWNATTKIKRWGFATEGNKEVWAEVKDSMDETYKSSANILAKTGAIKFVQGDIVRATTILNVRNDSNDKIGNVFAGFAGEILGPSKIVTISGIEYKFWKIDWKWKIVKHSKYSWDGFAELTPEEKILGWVAENWLLENTIYWLAKVITNEAGGENILDKEKLAVGWTVLNRLNCEGKHGNTIQDVAFEGYVPYWNEPHYEPLNSKIINLAEELFDGKIEDPTAGATHFFSPISQLPQYGEGPYPVPYSSGTEAYYARWAQPKDGWEIISETTTNYLTLNEELEWRNLEGIRNYYFMFYRYYNKEISLLLESPGELRVYDSNGNVTGLIDGVVMEEIPGSKYQDETVIIYYPTDDYRFQIIGIAQGNYNLRISKLTINNATEVFNANNIPISSNEIHQYSIDWIILINGEESVKIQIDIDGDGEFDYVFYSDSELSQEEYLDAIQDEPGTTSIPGYNLFILIGAICLVILITKKQFKNHS